MVCRECGTRNLPNETFCARCGASLRRPEVAQTPPEATPPSPAEEQAAEVRACLAKGDIKRAMDLAKDTVAIDPEAPLAHILLGDVYLRIKANDDALRAFRCAVEVDPDNAEAREKAEVARKRIIEPEGAEAEAPSVVGIGRLRLPLKAVPYVAGTAAALLVFVVGAAVLVSQTTPSSQRKRAFEQQMTVGREHYGAGRYRQAAEAFSQAARLDPSSTEAGRRLQDARAMAGMGPFRAGGRQTPESSRVAVLGPTTTPNASAFAPQFVGPRPGPAPTQETSRPRGAAPPPPIPVPDPTGTDGMRPELPPPIPPGTNVPGTRPPAGIGAEATADEHPTEAPPLQAASEIVIEWVPTPTRTAPTQSTAAADQGETSAAEALRAEADRFRSRGQWAKAARKYSEAAARFRQEAGQSGPDAATKRIAATTCERAREACESHLE